MSTFIGQLVGFSLIVFLGWRYVAPLIRRLMANQQHAIRVQLDDSAAAKRQLAEAENAHQAAVERAGAEAKRVTEEARTDAERIGEQLREQADFEVERIKVQGAQQVQLLRAQLIRQMQHDLGAESLNRAGELVRDHVSDPGAQSATVDRLLDEVEAMAPSPTVIEDPAMAQLRSASRDALSALVARFDAVSADLDEDGLTTLADELASVARLLHREPILTRHLADSSGNSPAKDALLERVLSGKVGAATLEVLKGAVSGRWSEDADLIHAVEHVAQLSLLVRAERAGQAGEVEEQLFRFGRLLDAQPRLAKLLSSYTQPVEGRLELLRNVLSSSTAVNPTTAELLSQTVNLLRGERAEDAVRELAQLAVARHGEVVAHVEAAADLTDAQRTRLTEILSRIYGHPVSVQLQIKPELLGGLNITVGDEVIDGTLSSKLAAAETQLLD